MQLRFSARGKIIVALVLVYASYLGYLSAHAMLIKRRNPTLSEALLQKRNRQFLKTVKMVKRDKNKYVRTYKDVGTLLFL